MYYDPSKFIKCTVPAADVKRVKGMGCLWNKCTPDCFNCRVVTRNGKITAEETIALAEAAKQFGNGEIAFTTRMSAEIQAVPYDKIDAMCAFLAQHGLEIGGTGPKVRPIVSCKGTTCQFGLIDTYGLALKMHERFYVGYHQVKLPHKFKIAVGGCPNNCVKPDINDVGIIGQRKPIAMVDICKDCKACEKACPVGAASVTDHVFTADSDICNRCGRCVKHCPFTALDCVDGYKITVGGRWGKRVARGQALDHLFTSEEEVLAAVEKIILLYRDLGTAGERFSDTIARIGFDRVQALVLSDELLNRKAEILEKEL